ncbi:uncharacterized protein LOC130736754 [Lotus japonicus]|uniref:uncharacterized protein LOC130736754 n=1 Tax=Lotus japonicus TaxID=34305 RepID=UPI002589D5CA|nr:uncharacterized protein LOC130736754 [Lotus japonicus]
MRILSWNCRGLGNLPTERALIKLIHSKVPDVVFVSETRLYAAEAQRRRRLGGMSNVFPVGCAGNGKSRGGGLCMWWRHDLELEIINSSLNHIMCTILHPDTQLPMTLIGVYGFPDNRRKRDTWNLIRGLLGGSARPCLVIGDFNDLVSPTDKLGGDPPDYGHLQWVTQMCSSCDLHEVDFSGYRFTWSNKQEEPNNIQERIDFALTNSAWDALWASTFVSHMQKHRSDHSPLLLTCDTYRRRKELARKRMFRFEEMWLREGRECEEVVSENWCQEGATVMEKLALVSGALDGWGKEKFGDLPQKISYQQAILQNLQWQQQTEQVILSMQGAEKELDALLEQEEIWWGQRSRASWLAHGDRNTRQWKEVYR